MSDKTVLTNFQIAELAQQFDIAAWPGGSNFEFARAIERAVLAASEDRRDAERYRCLRNQAPETIDDLGRLKSAEEFDAAIDAIAAAGHKVEG